MQQQLTKQDIALIINFINKMCDDIDEAREKIK